MEHATAHGWLNQPIGFHADREQEVVYLIHVIPVEVPAGSRDDISLGQIASMREVSMASAALALAWRIAQDNIHVIVKKAVSTNTFEAARIVHLLQV